MAIFISLNTSHLFLVCFSSYPAMACLGSARDLWKCQKGNYSASKRLANIKMRSELIQLAHLNMFHYTCMFKRTHSLFMVSAFTTCSYFYLCYSSHSRTRWHSKTNVFQTCFKRVCDVHMSLSCTVFCYFASQSTQLPLTVAMFCSKRLNHKIVHKSCRKIVHFY